MGREVKSHLRNRPCSDGRNYVGTRSGARRHRIKRNALLPDVPPISDTVPGYSTLGWYSVVAPAGTPEAVLTKASAEVAKAVKEPQFGESLKAWDWISSAARVQSSMHSAANSASK